MQFSTKHIGNSAGNPAKLLEVTVSTGSFSYTENVLDFKTDKVDEDLISQLRQLADELQEHNDLVDSNSSDECVGASEHDWYKAGEVIKYSVFKCWNCDAEKHK